MHIGRLLLLPLPYKLDSVSPFDFPFFYWVEEMKRKEGNEQKKKKKGSICFLLSITQNLYMSFGEEEKLKIISRQLIIP